MDCAICQARDDRSPVAAAVPEQVPRAAPQASFRALLHATLDELMAEHPDRDTQEFLAELLRADTPSKISKHMFVCGGGSSCGKSYVPAMFE